jgi:ATP-dependent helicase/nuclease subunit A
MGAGRDDRRLKEIVLDAHTKLMSHPDPAAWTEAQIRQLESLDASVDAGKTMWGAVLMGQARRTAAYWQEALSALIDDAAAAQPDFLAAYGESLEATCQGIECFLDALERGWDAARDASKIPFPRAKSLKGYDELKQIRIQCKDAMKKMAEMFECTSAELMEDMAAVRPATAELLRLVLDFDSQYAALKRRRGLIDFADQEHLAARLLVDFGSGNPTVLAETVAARYEEVMVDEYQDVNAVQELIFTAVTQGGRNLFMVGDVRQSIYRFRLADPTIFLRKYNTYVDAADAAEGQARKILLATNFRSRPGVLDAVNHVFRYIMTEEFAEMDYTEREYLYAGREETNGEDPAVELYVVDMCTPEREDEEESEKKEEGEAKFIAAHIEKMVREGYPIPDGDGGVRPCRYADFAILLRSMKNLAPVYAEALRYRSIPCAYGTDTDFSQTAEIAIMLALLDVIDNPHQDIPLLTVLKSPLFGFTPDELAEIRCADPSGDFFEALSSAAEHNRKCTAFLMQLTELRDLAAELPVDRLIWHIYTVTGMLGLFGALPDGAGRRENLMRLLQYAAQFESSGWRGLFDFTVFLRRLREKGEEPISQESGAGGDAVKIMSIHKSKGLEFPIVFLAGTTKRFNLMDTHKPLLIHAGLGIGPKRVDLDRRIEYPTFARMAVSQIIRRETVAEELRVLYVGMTRAREKLIITASYNDALRELDKMWGEARPLFGGWDEPFETEVLERVRDLAGLILLPALRRQESAALFGEEVPPKYERQWKMRYVRAEGIDKTDESEPDDAAMTESAQSGEASISECAQRGADALSEGALCVEKKTALPEGARSEAETNAAAEEARREAVIQLHMALNYQYPFGVSEQLPSKITATELKGRFIDAEAADEAEPMQTQAAARRRGYDRPAFITESTDLTPTERGTALHLAMQHVRYENCTSPEAVGRELERLVREKLITQRQAESVAPERIAAFFNSPLGRRVLAAENIWREFKFSLLLAPHHIPFQLSPEELKEWEASGDEILFQGVIDCCFEEGGRLHIIDFKTDRAPKAQIEERARGYAGQIAAYSHAMERITGKPVASGLVYFFAVDTAVEVFSPAE